MRKKFLLVAGTLAFGLDPTSSSAYGPEPFTIDLGKLSDPVKNMLIRSLLGDKLRKEICVVCGANPDPDYSEFWLEMRPKDPGMNPGLTNHMPAFRNGQSPPIMQAADWSEEAFAEITPTFAEMEPDSKALVNHGPWNKILITMHLSNAAKKGIGYGTNVYEEILSAISSHKN